MVFQEKEIEYFDSVLSILIMSEKPQQRVCRHEGWRQLSLQQAEPENAIRLQSPLSNHLHATFFLRIRVNFHYFFENCIQNDVVHYDI